MTIALLADFAFLVSQPLVTSKLPCALSWRSRIIQNLGYWKLIEVMCAARVDIGVGQRKARADGSVVLHYTRGEGRHRGRHWTVTHCTMHCTHRLQIRHTRTGRRRATHRTTHCTSRLHHRNTDNLGPVQGCSRGLEQDARMPDDNQDVQREVGPWCRERLQRFPESPNSPQRLRHQGMEAIN